MSYKSLILTLCVCLFMPAVMSAKDRNPELDHVQGELFDGSIIEGYTKTAFVNFMRPWVTEVKLSETPGGEEHKYTSEELKKVWFTTPSNDSIPLVFESVRAQKSLPNYLNKNPKPYKKPVFLRLIYNGENVKGYIRPVADFTHTPSMSISTYTYIIYYLTKDSDVAVAFWCETGDLVPGMRKVMKFYLRAFPELVKMVDDGTLTPNMFRENPAIVLPIMDRTYTSPKAE